MILNQYVLTNYLDRWCVASYSVDVVSHIQRLPNFRNGPSNTLGKFEPLNRIRSVMYNHSVTYKDGNILNMV